MRGMRKNRRRSGFTLLEVLLVVVILGMLAALVVPNFIGVEAQTKRRTAQSMVSGGGAIATAIKLYRTNMGKYPESLADLTKVPDDSEEAAKYGSTPLIEPGTLKDPWGNEYQYKCPGDINKDSYDLYSFAEDGQEGGEGDSADVGNWTTDQQ